MSFKKLQEDTDQHDYTIRKISLQTGKPKGGKYEVFIMNTISQPLENTLYYYIKHTNILKWGPEKGTTGESCFDPPEDDHNWTEIKNHQMRVLTMRGRRALEGGFRSLKNDPANTGKSTQFQYGSKEKNKLFECKYKDGMTCPAIKWISKGDRCWYKDVITNKKHIYKLFSVLYEHKHTHDPPPKPPLSTHAATNPQINSKNDENQVRPDNTAKKAAEMNDRSSSDKEDDPAGNDDFSDGNGDINISTGDESMAPDEENDQDKVQVLSDNKDIPIDKAYGNDGLAISPNEDDTNNLAPTETVLEIQKGLDEAFLKMYGILEQAQDLWRKRSNKNTTDEIENMMCSNNLFGPTIEESNLMTSPIEELNNQFYEQGTSTSSQSLITRQKSDDCLLQDDIEADVDTENFCNINIIPANNHTEEYHKSLFPKPTEVDLYTIKNMPVCCKAYVKSMQDKEKEKKERRENEKNEKNKVGCPQALEQPQCCSHSCYRSFENHSKEHCWLNSCLQFMVGGIFDHKENQVTTSQNSKLWQMLNEIKQQKGKINPLGVLNLILSKERDRIMKHNIKPNASHFHYAETTENQLSKLMVLDHNMPKIGQQDCREFFTCLESCKDEWKDVCDLFNCTLKVYTYCPACKKSTQPTEDSAPFIFIDTPKENIMMDNLVNQKFNAPDSVNWKHKDKDGCGKETIGQVHHRIKNIEDQEFIIFIVERARRNRIGKMVIDQTKITITPTIDIRKLNEDQTESDITVQFEPIAIIHHTGGYTTDAENPDKASTFGHYKADILDHESKEWIRTSDDKPAEKIPFESITKHGYIFLYKRKKNVENSSLSNTSCKGKGKGKGKSSNPNFKANELNDESKEAKMKIEDKIESEQFLMEVPGNETEEFNSGLDIDTFQLKEGQRKTKDEKKKKKTVFDESHSLVLPKLRPELENIINKVLKSSESTVLIDAHKIQIRTSDIQTLSGLNWLNDEIINFYMQMIVARSKADPVNFRSVYALSSFFYTNLKNKGYDGIKKWTKDVDLFSYSLILIPIHIDIERAEHWCLATIDMDKKTIVYYDSLGGDNKFALKLIFDYLQQECKARKGLELDLRKWETFNARNIPKQNNGSDCGMFTCKYAEYLSRGADFDFCSSNMPYFRKQMMYEITRNEILYPSSVPIRVKTPPPVESPNHSNYIDQYGHVVHHWSEKQARAHGHQEVMNSWPWFSTVKPVQLDLKPITQLMCMNKKKRLNSLREEIADVQKRIDRIKAKQEEETININLDSLTWYLHDLQETEEWISELDDSRNY